MRIATSTITNMATSSMGNAYDNYANIIKKIASNKNFTSISQNPVDATKVLKLNDQLAQLNEYQSNIQAAINEMNLAYDTLGDVTSRISDINDLIIEASNATTQNDSAQALSVEIREKVNSIKDLMNTKYMDNFIFSGTYISNQPYKEDENGLITYQGSSKEAGQRNLTIAQDTIFSYNFTGEEIFGTKGNAQEFFSQMKELDELLNADTLDFDAIRKKLDITNTAIKNVTQAQGNVSSKVSKLLAAKDNNIETITSLTENRADLEEVDIAKASSDLANAYTQLQASYAMGTRILGSVSLLDYI